MAAVAFAFVAGASAAPLAACSSPAPVDPVSPEARTPTEAPLPSADLDAGKSPLVTVDASDAASVGTSTPLTILPDTTYSGFDGAHAYRVPIAVYGADAAQTQITVSDPAIVKIEPTTLTDPQGDKGTWFLLTTLKAGTVTITASAGAKTVEATMHVADYGVDRYAAGEARYMASSDPTSPPCVQCHGGANGIDHSPSRMASATDNEVVGVIRTGILVEGSPIMMVKHQWKVTDAEAAGLVTYLRALAPRGFVAAK